MSWGISRAGGLRHQHGSMARDLGPLTLRFCPINELFEQVGVHGRALVSIEITNVVDRRSL